MEIKIDFRILGVFFEEPNKARLIREIARKTKINHTTVGQYLKYLVKEGILEKENEGLYAGYKASFSQKYFNLKLFYNLEKIRISGLIKDLQNFYDFPTIILFGSYAHTKDDSGSDIDFCLLTEVEKELNTEKYEKSLNRKISLHIFSKKKWNSMKEKNKELVNSICNGIVLSGELEIL